VLAILHVLGLREHVKVKENGMLFVPAILDFARKPFQMFVYRFTPMINVPPLSKLSPEQRSTLPASPSAFPPGEVVASNYLRGMTQADAAEVVLKEAGGGPLDTRTIVRAMVARGFQDKPERKNLISSVFAVMTKLPMRFQKVGRGLWILASLKDDQEKNKAGK
jgi:hypothetical protein